jgi:plasmid maintenance system antidote protein VapI
MNAKNWLMYKYRINEILEGMSMKEYKKAIKLIPKIIGVSQNTFANYRNIKIEDNRDIPYQKVILLGKIFGIDSDNLVNFKIEQKSLAEMMLEDLENG